MRKEWYNFTMPEDTKISPIPVELPRESLLPKEHVEGEKTKEKELLLPEESPEQAKEAPSVSPPKPTAAPATPPPRRSPEKSEELFRIERILEEGLQDMYWQLPPPMQEKLKQRGEKTARTIERLLQAVRLNTAKILRLIRKWLSTIPHVNKFFLEQEAKIKTDKFVALHRERHNRP